MSESCLPSSPPLMLPSASSSQSTTSPLSSSPPGFARNAREFTVCPTLNPSSKERQREYYLRMERREDCSKSFPAIPTHEQIRASTPRDGQTHGPTSTFSTPGGPQTHGAMFTASTPSLESLMHYIDRRIGEHETYLKSMLANHEAVIVQKMEENTKAIMKKIESVMAMNKQACSGVVNVEFERELSRGVETRDSEGDNFECQ